MNPAEILNFPKPEWMNEEVNLVADMANRFMENEISPNYETYERDVKNIKGFTIRNIEIFDQFPNTKHLEIVSLLSRE